MFSAKAVTAATAANARIDVANDRSADNARLAGAQADKERRRLAGIRLFKTIHPEMTDAEAATAADADPMVVDRMFATLQKHDDAKEKAAAKMEQDARDRAARDIAIRLGRTGLEPTDDERAALAASTNGTAVYSRFFEGRANRTSRESEGALNRTARERAAAAANLAKLKIALRAATKDEAVALHANAKEDLKEWMDEHRNDFLSAEDMAKDEGYRLRVQAVQEAQNRIAGVDANGKPTGKGTASEAKTSIEDEIREAQRLNDEEDARGGAGGETPWEKAQKDPAFKALTPAQKEALRKRLGG